MEKPGKEKSRNAKAPLHEADVGFKRLKQKNTARHIRQRVYYVALLFVLLVVFLIGVVAIFFRVSSITVKGNEVYEDEDIVKASGITKGMNIYLADESEAREGILTEFPYIRTVDMDRNLPSGITLSLKSDSADYYIEIGGECFVLSEGLRVLERSSDQETLTKKYPGIIKFKADDVKTAIVGREMEFVNESYSESAKEFLKIFGASEIKKGVSSIDFTDRFNIYVVYEKRLKANLGNGEDTELKLRFMQEIVKDLGDSRGTIDIKDVETGYVLLDGTAEYD